MERFENFCHNNAGPDWRFPGGDDPFMIVFRRVEEGGELAPQVNYLGGRGG